MNNEMILKLVKLIRHISRDLEFTIFEIGALPLEGEAEPFHQILDFFNKSKIYAFEVDEGLCNQLNRQTTRNIQFFPVALGRTEETRTFYNTNHPMCGSLYKPNEELISLYNCMEVAYLETTSQIQTVSLDCFCDKHNIHDIDFIKIDVQGAELEIFSGGVQRLGHVIAIVSEVEFLPLYVDQPLFGDVSSFLQSNDLMFHKFLSLSGRSIKPIVVDNNPCNATQHLWSDAMFIRNAMKLEKVSPEKLLKLALIAFLYWSPDVTFQCFKLYDQKKNTSFLEKFKELWC